MSAARCVLVGCLTIAMAAAGVRADVNGRQVRRAIDDGIAYLRNSQHQDGAWEDFGSHTGGTTALGILALLTAGVGKDDPAVRKALHALLDVKHDRTYVIALKAMALAAADPAAFKNEIQRCADDLSRWQLDNGTWSYGSPEKFRNMGDNSNTQYALLGLYEAAKAGAKFPPAVFDRSDRWFRKTIADDGGWRYVGTAGTRLGTMTAAAVASLYITGGQVHSSQERGFQDGAAANCGRYAQDVHIAEGLAWLARNFNPNVPPGADMSHLFYWYYAFERVGVLAGQRYFGEHDWFREGAERLVLLQQADGSWPAGRYNKVVNTSYAVLFLTKGRLPVLINKLRHPGNWNLDQDDIKNLCTFINANKVFKDAVGWQVVGAEAPLQHWMDAPLLYFNGHTWPEFDGAQIARLRAFLERGGTLFVEACCSRPEFDAGFRAFVKKHLPEYGLSKLDAAHPVYHSQYDFGDNPPPLFGVDLACRTSIIYSPRDMSCLWQQQAVNEPLMRDVTIRAFQLGTNIAAYAAGREPLPDKLQAVTLPAPRVRPDETTIRGAVQIAQVQHSGDWRPCVHAMPNLTKLLRDKAGVDVVDKPEALRLEDPNLFTHPIIFMTGHHKFELTDKEKTALKQYLSRGGFLFAEACCGRGAFDESFRALMAELFPDPKHVLTPLPASHPIITGRDERTGQGVGFDIRKVKYKAMALQGNPALRADRDGMAAPVLAAVTIDGRPAVIYSPYALACGLDGMLCGSCRGIDADDAKKLSINVILYSLAN